MHLIKKKETRIRTEYNYSWMQEEYLVFSEERTYIAYGAHGTREVVFSFSEMRKGIKPRDKSTSLSV